LGFSSPSLLSDPASSKATIFKVQPTNSPSTRPPLIYQLNSSKKKGLLEYIDAENAHVVVLSETKVSSRIWRDTEQRGHSLSDLSASTPQLTSPTLLICSFCQVNELKDVEIASDMKPLRDSYPYRYWGIGTKKGYAGVAILSKTKAISKQIGLPNLKGYDSNGRISESEVSISSNFLGNLRDFPAFLLTFHFLSNPSISPVTLEFENTYVIGTYVVNAGEGLKVSEHPVE